MSPRDELNWLNSLKLQTNPAAKKPVRKTAAKKTARKKNPFDPLSAFANIGVGAVSALHLHDRLKTKRKATKRNPAKAQRLKWWTVEIVSGPYERKEVWVKAISRIEAIREAERSNKGFRWVHVREGKQAKQNPASIPTRKTYEMFQGRPATSSQEMPVSIHAPRSLDQLGDLMEIKLGNGETLDFTSRSFGKTTYPHKLCANPAGTRLWIAGKAIAKPNPELKAHEIEIYAPIVHIVYGTRKAHLDRVYTHYIHALGEETGDLPQLAIDQQGHPVIHGGAYTIEDRGIVN